MTIDINDIVDKQFGRLTVIGFAYSKDYTRPDGTKQTQYYYNCKCNCINKTIVTVNRYDLTRNDHPTKSCGCLVAEKVAEATRTHGMSRTRFYHIWQSMIQRCNNPKHEAYIYYGGRGIKVDPSWETFENFYNDMYESYTKYSDEHGERNTTIDRENVNGNYCLTNCKWTDYHNQNINKQSTKKYLYNGNYYTITELYNNFAQGISWTGFRDRIYKLNLNYGDEITDESIFYKYESPIKFKPSLKRNVSEMERMSILKNKSREELIKRRDGLV